MKSEELRIAFLAPHSNEISETFIHLQYELLKGEYTHFLYGKNYPIYSDKFGDLKHENSLIQKFLNKILIFLKIKTYQSPQKLAFEKYLLKHKIELVLCQYGTYATKIFDSVKKLKIPLIVYFQGYDAYIEEIIKENKSKYESLFCYASKIISVSKHMTQQLIKIGAVANKLVEIPYPPNYTFLNGQADYNSHKFVAVGRFVDKKAPYLTILAFAKVHHKHPQALLKMIGTGYLLNMCQNLVMYLGLKDAVLFLGNQEPQKVKIELQDAFCFVQHSITADNGDSEGMPLSIKEASAMGLPLVVTDHAGIPEEVIHQETGFMVAEKDVEGMANYMIQLYEDRNLAKCMGNNGKKLMQQCFSVEKYKTALEHTVKKKYSVEDKQIDTSD